MSAYYVDAASFTATDWRISQSAREAADRTGKRAIHAVEHVTMHGEDHSSRLELRLGSGDAKHEARLGAALRAGETHPVAELLGLSRSDFLTFLGLQAVRLPLARGASVVALCAIILTGLGLLSPTLAKADPGAARVVYELQERCGLQAARWFKAQYSLTGTLNAPDGRQIMGSFRNHYSARLNKCFVLIHAIPVKPKQLLEWETLTDLNDNHGLGTFVQVNGEVLGCKVQDTFCAGDAEWQALIKPFLEQ
jgi:hypothetical protein